MKEIKNLGRDNHIRLEEIHRGEEVCFSITDTIEVKTYIINEVGKTILKLCNKGKTNEKIIEIVLTSFDIENKEKNAAIKEITNFISDLKEKKLIQNNGQLNE